MEKNPHHLVMGELTDFLTGEIRPDTHDERFRQKIARLLVQTCGYDRSDIETRRKVIIQIPEKQASLRMDFLVRSGDRIGMMIRYAPGSLVTRRLPNLALSRIVHSYQIPVVVTTNGEDAEILDGLSGKVRAQGLDAIPDKQSLSGLTDPASFPVISRALFEQASRIAYACEVDGACPCDTDVCTLDPDSSAVQAPDQAERILDR